MVSCFLASLNLCDGGVCLVINVFRAYEPCVVSLATQLIGTCMVMYAQHCAFTHREAVEVWNVSIVEKSKDSCVVCDRDVCV